jgi:homoserine O-acetyltransferase/O-succinyltransferase
MHALEWAFIGQGFVRASVVIGCGAQHTAWQIGISETQRQAIYMDPKWNKGDINPDDPPVQGLALAREIAMISYRSAYAYQQKFGRQINAQGDYEVKSYLLHQVRYLPIFSSILGAKIAS